MSFSCKSLEEKESSSLKKNQTQDPSNGDLEREKSIVSEANDPLVPNRISKTFLVSKVTQVPLQMGPDRKNIKEYFTMQKGDQITPQKKEFVQLQDASINSFVLSSNTIPESISAKVDETAYVVKSFSESTGHVKFEQTVPAGKTIVIKFLTLDRNTNKTNFQLAADLAGDEPVNLEVINFTTKTKLSASFRDGFVMIDPSDFVEEQNIEVSFVHPMSENNEIKISHIPIEDSIKIFAKTDGDETLPCDAADIVFVSASIKFYCSLPTNSIIHISYEYETERQTTFDLVEIPYAHLATWRVFINGNSTEDFVSKGTKLSFLQELPPGATIKVDLVYNQIDEP
jgi:hypothetical protein